VGGVGNRVCAVFQGPAGDVLVDAPSTPGAAQRLHDDVRSIPPVARGASRQREEHMLATRQDLRAMCLLAFVEAHEDLRHPSLGRHAKDALAALARDDAVLSPADAEGSVGRAIVTASSPVTAILLSAATATRAAVAAAKTATADTRGSDGGCSRAWWRHHGIGNRAAGCGDAPRNALPNADGSAADPAGAPWSTPRSRRSRATLPSNLRGVVP